MNAAKRDIGRRWMIPFVAAVWISAVLVGSGQTARAAELLHARISQESGGALVKGTQDDDWSYATINTIVLPGDTLWVDKEGTLELEMSGGSFLRMADTSKAEVVQLPPSAAINGWTGAFYVQRISRSTGDFKFRAPAATVNIERDSLVRIDIVGQGSTTVSVRWGRATIVTEGGAPVTATDGQRVYVDPGLLPSLPAPFDRTAEDAFDAWNRERARLLATGESSIPTTVRTESLPIGYADLSAYGNWVYVDNRPYWQPTIIREYVPYRVGYWSYAPVYGYAWVGSYPFCYVTSHYGRWSYNTHYGWIWGYDPVWSPAWCATVRYGPNFVWCPIDFYGRPISYGATFSVGGTAFSIAFSSYCVATDLISYGPCAVYPAYSSIFVNVPSTNIYVWNIYCGNVYRPPRPVPYPYVGAPLPYREFIPQRALRGLPNSGIYNFAAAERVRTLESIGGRAQFAARVSGGPGSIRTSQVASVRQARTRDTVLNANAAFDPVSTIRRGERNLGALRGAHLDRPEVTEARRSRLAKVESELIAFERDNPSLRGSGRFSSARSVRGDNGTDFMRGRGDDALSERSRASLQERSIDRGIEPLTQPSPDRGKAPTSDRMPGRSRTPLQERTLENERGPAQGSSLSIDRGRSGGTVTEDLRGRTLPGERQGLFNREAGKSPVERSSETGNAPTLGPRPNERVTSREIRRTEVPDRISSEGPASRITPPDKSPDPGPIFSPRNTPGQGLGRTPAPAEARLREQIVPRISGGDGRNSNSQSLGTLPNVPQRNRSLSTEGLRTFTPAPQSQSPQRSALPDLRSRVEPRIAEAPRMTAPQMQRFEAPTPQIQRQSPRIETPAPRFEAPAPRVQAPTQRMQAPMPQYQPPAPRMSAPEPRSFAPQAAPRMELPQRPAPQVSAPQLPAPPARGFETPRIGTPGPARGDFGGGVARGRAR